MTSTIPARTATDPAIHGGKAAQLARLAAAELPVPDGLVIPSTLPEDQIGDATDAVLAWAATTGAAHGLILRSSSPTEDGPKASFAGLYASCFAVAEPSAIRTAIDYVRASGRAAAVHAYAAVHDIQPPTGVAVIAQAALRPYCAGVLAGRLADGRWQAWQLEAVHGLADPLVSGHASGELHHHSTARSMTAAPAEQTALLLPGRPDELLLPPGEWITLDGPHGESARAKISTSADGIVTVLRPPAWKARPILGPADIVTLLGLAMAAAHAIGVDAIDLEWAITADGVAHVLQARPLTHDVPAPRPTTSAGAVDGWQGIPASPGIAAGPSLNLAHAARAGCSAHGAIVVCGNLGPDAADALLQGPAAIAATTGGPLSHAAIVARELGIPCVTGLPKSLLDLSDGTNLTVDGIAGTLHVGHIAANTSPERAPTLDGSAVLCWPGQASTDDGRAATLLLLNQGGDPLEVMGALRAHSVPVGVLQFGDAPLPHLPDRYGELHLPGLGRLGWPHDAGPVPPHVLVLDGHTPIWQRPLTPVAGPRPAPES